MAGKGNQGFSIEKKITTEGYKPYDNNGFFKPWVICQFLRQELKLTIRKIEKDVPKIRRKPGLFKVGIDKIDEEILTNFIKYCRQEAKKKHPPVYKLDLFTINLFHQNFKDLLQLQSYLKTKTNIHICNVKNLHENISNSFALSKLQIFCKSKTKNVALFSGPEFSGKTSAMSNLYEEIKQDVANNVIYLDITGMANVTLLQAMLIEQLKSAYKRLDPNTANIDSLTLVDLLNLRKKWILLLDTDDSTVHGAAFQRLVTQNDYLTFITRLNRKLTTDIKVIISEQLSDQNLPKFYKNQIDKITADPVNPEPYILEKYGKKITSVAQKQFYQMSANFILWSEEQRYIYGVLLNLLEKFSALSTDYKELNSTFEKRYDISSLLREYAFKFCPEQYKKYYHLIIESLLEIEEGFKFSTLKQLCLIHQNSINGDSNESINFDEFLINNQWIEVFVTKTITQDCNIVLKPALRKIFKRGGIEVSKETRESLLKLCEDMAEDTNNLEKLFNTDLSKPENYLAVHTMLLPGLHAFKLKLSLYRSSSENKTERKKVIKDLYQIYDKYIEFNNASCAYQKNGFSLAKVFLSYDVKLQLVSDIIGLNEGLDNGRLITNKSAIRRALSVDKIFYLLESLSVASVACLRYGSLAKASYLLSSLYSLLIKGTKETKDSKTKEEKKRFRLSIAKRCQARVYQNDIVLKRYFNPRSSINPTLNFAELLIKDINELEVGKEILPSPTFYYRRLTKVWIDCARMYLTDSPTDSLSLISTLPYEKTKPKFFNKRVIKTEVTKKFTSALKHLVEVDMSNNPNTNNADKYRDNLLQQCMNTYAVTANVYITQRNLLYRYLDVFGTSNNSDELNEEKDKTDFDITPKFSIALLKRSYENLLLKAETKYRSGIHDFSNLYCMKTALLRGQSTCRFLIEKPSALIFRREVDVSSLKPVLQELDNMIQKLDRFDEQALFLNTDSSHLISSSHYLIRKCIRSIAIDNNTLNENTVKDINIEINHKIEHLKSTREIRLILELEFFLVLMDMLLYFTATHKHLSKEMLKSEEHIKKIRGYRAELTKLNIRFQEQGRGKELDPLFIEIDSFLKSKVTNRIKYLTFIIIMFF